MNAQNPQAKTISTAEYVGSLVKGIYKLEEKITYLESENDRLVDMIKSSMKRAETRVDTRSTSGEARKNSSSQSNVKKTAAKKTTKKVVKKKTTRKLK